MVKGGQDRGYSEGVYWEMIKRFTIKGVRVTFTIARITKVIGVNSVVGDNLHIPMWDFDGVPLDEVREALGKVLTRYGLSTIYILRTKEPSNYIAYCFTALDWRRVVEIIASTQHVDFNFFKYGVYRGRFTLRVTPKIDKPPRLVEKLEGFKLPNCTPQDLLSWVRYQTLRR